MDSDTRLFRFGNVRVLLRADVSLWDENEVKSFFFFNVIVLFFSNLMIYILDFLLMFG